MKQKDEVTLTMLDGRQILVGNSNKKNVCLIERHLIVVMRYTCALLLFLTKLFYTPALFHLFYCSFLCITYRNFRPG